MRFARRRAHQRCLFMNSNPYKSDVFQVASQLLVVITKGKNKRGQAVCEKPENAER